MPAFSRGTSSMRVARWLVTASNKLRTLDYNDPVSFGSGVKSVQQTLSASRQELSQVYDSCIDARNSYAAHPRIRKQLIAVAPLVRQALDRLDAIEEAIVAAPLNAQSQARAIGEVALEVAEFSFIPPQYVAPRPDAEDTL